MKKVIVYISILLSLISQNVIAQCLLIQNDPTIVTTDASSVWCADGTITLSHINPSPFPNDVAKVELWQDNGFFVDHKDCIAHDGSCTFTGLLGNTYRVVVYLFVYCTDTYSVCNNSYSVTVGQKECDPPPHITSQTNTSSPFCNDGTVTMSNGDKFTGLTAGVHQLTGNYPCGCQSLSYSVIATIIANPCPPPQFSFSKTNSTSQCGGGTITITGGRRDRKKIYSFYAWVINSLTRDTVANFNPYSGTSNSVTAPGLAPGTYTAFAEPTNSTCACKDSSTLTIDNGPPCNLSIDVFGTSPITNCSNGSINVKMMGGLNVDHYDITLTNINNQQVIATKSNVVTNYAQFANISTGSYAVDVKEYRVGSGNCFCEATGNVFVDTAKSSYFTANINTKDGFATGCANAQINIILPNQNDNYYNNFWQYSWQSKYTVYLHDSGWQLKNVYTAFDSLNITGLTQGTYNVLVIGQRFDAQTCPAPFIQPGIITSEKPCMLNLTTSAKIPSHYNCTDGTITVSMENFTNDCSPHIDLYNATDSLIDHWLPANGSLPYTFKNLPEGNYHIIAAAGNCSSDTIITINDGPCDIQFNISAVQGIHGCNANQLKVADSGNICGTLNFNYQNNDAPFNTGTFTSGDNINFATTNDLPPGNYTITGSSGSCTASHDFLLNDAPCTLNATATTAYNGTCSASISGTVTNFCTSLTIELRRSSDDSLYKSVNTSGNSFLFDMLGNGSYKIVVTDAGGCTVTKTATISGLSCTPPTGGSYTAITSRKGTVSWDLSNCAAGTIGYTVQYRVQGTSGWSVKQVNTNTNSVVLSNLQSNTVYECHIKTKCVSNVASAFGPIFTFNTNGSLSAAPDPEAVKSASVDDQEIKAIPNPTNGKVTIVFNADKPGKYSIDITSTNGKLLQHKDAIAIKGENKIQFDLSNFTAGFYVIVLKNDAQPSRNAKLIKL